MGRNDADDTVLNAAFFDSGFDMGSDVDEGRRFAVGPQLNFFLVNRYLNASLSVVVLMVCVFL